MTLKLRNLGSAVQSGLAVSIIIPLPFDFVYQHLPDSRLVALTLLNHMQALFPRWYNLDEMWISLWVPQPVQLNSCKNFKNWDRMMVSKKQVEFVKNDVIGHIVTRTSSDWQKIENAWQSTNIARKADPRMVLNCQSFHYGLLPLCILFWVTSHPWTKHVFPLSFCCFEIKRCFFQNVCWQNILIKLQHAKLRLVNPKRLKVFWLQKWLDIC